MTDPSSSSGSSTAAGALRRALASRVEERSIALRVPKTDVVVRYRAVELKELQRIRDRFQKAKNPTDAQQEKAGLKANPAILAQACEGVFVVDDGQLVSADPGGEPPRFDERLLELLGAPGQQSEADIVRLLFDDNDLDIASAVRSVTDFSGGAEAEVFEDELGN